MSITCGCACRLLHCSDRVLEIMGAMSCDWRVCCGTSRWGYETIDEVEQVVANYTAAAIPLETMWTDIDCAPSVLCTSIRKRLLLLTSR